MKTNNLKDSIINLGNQVGAGATGVLAVEGVPQAVPGQPLLQSIIQVVIAITTLWPSIRALFKKKG